MGNKEENGARRKIYPDPTRKQAILLLKYYGAWHERELLNAAHLKRIPEKALIRSIFCWSQGAYFGKCKIFRVFNYSFFKQRSQKVRDLIVLRKLIKE